MRLTRSAVCLGVIVLGSIGLCVAMYQAVSVGAARADTAATKPDLVAAGYEIFNREWLPNDPRGHGGDGLGPVYNDSSCVACHNAGGSGGGGPVSKNIDILSAGGNGGMPMAASNGGQGHGQASPAPSAALDPLFEVHPGFRTSRAVVLHKFGTDPNYDSWRAKAPNPSARQTLVLPGGGRSSMRLVQGGGRPIQPNTPSAMMTFDINPSQDQAAAGDADANRAAERMQRARESMVANNPLNGMRVGIGSFIVARSQRNPTALFGLGVIDAIPDASIEAMERHQAMQTPDTKGRVSRLKDGRIGRLGWKGQTANTEDFVLNACAVELGLEVPGHHQAMTPQAPRYQPPGLDLTAEECNALVAYVRSLPRPVENRPSGAEESRPIEAGRSTFASIGCASCHAPKVGNVVGIFSDLLLHDMGPELGDEGSYDGSSSEGDDEPLSPWRTTVAQGGAQPNQGAQPTAPRGATRREWRTPPLWGFRDSGPYLHDGRAQTLEQAVAMHGGQGQASANKFFRLSPRERLQVESFLKSLVAPPPLQLASRGD
jgi:CxxC motif-containing protein (DUF1111 family)